MTKRASFEQRTRLFAFMQEHEDLARGRVSGPVAARTKKLLLEQLADELNALGSGATKSPEKWLKCWQDWKSDTKSKYLRIKKARAEGINGGPSPVPLTPLEISLLTFFGLEIGNGLQGVIDPLKTDSEKTDILSATPSPAISASSPTLFIDRIEIVVAEGENGVPLKSSLQQTSPPQASSTQPESNFDPSNSQTKYGAVSSRLRRLKRASPRGDLGLKPSARGGAPSRRIFRSTERHARKTPKYVEHIRQEFLRAEELNRDLLIEKGRRDDERIRLRAIELEIEKRWQDLLSRGLDVLNRFIDKI